MIDPLGVILFRENGSSTQMSPRDQIELFLRTGKGDSFDLAWPGLAWPGENFMECARSRDKALRQALISEVEKRAPRAVLPDELFDLDLEAFVRKKTGPMVRGLFPVSEQPTVMQTLSRSIVFLTSYNIAPIILSVSFLSTAWQLANLYLLSCGVALLSNDAPDIVGFSEATTCYVSTAYFSESAFTDYVVHEVAHVFHNCKRETIGLSEIRGREWLLAIDYCKRELFAYACEAYSCILTMGQSVADRRRLLTEIESDWMPTDSRVDLSEFRATLHEAVEARNGWKRILKRCAPPPRTRSSSAMSHMSAAMAL